MSANISVEFHGGAGEVTGACYLMSSPIAKLLIDCGLFQGSHALEKKNHEDFRFDPSEIDAVFITHSHIDHIGRLPKLVKDGFRGRIYSTGPTRELAQVMLEDALHFMKDPGTALYTREDIKQTLSLWETLPYYNPKAVGDCEVVFKNAGHILGSAMIEINAAGTKILFSGDFGNMPSVLLPPPDTLSSGVEYLFIESTYGDKVHTDTADRALKLERAIEDVATRGGTLMIPAFATERTQDILYELNEMVLRKRIPDMPVFVDAPLAIKITDVFRKHPALYNSSVQEIMKSDPHVFDFRGLRFTESVEESKMINDVHPPKVILAGSGMSSGGRIVHHEIRYLQDPKSILLIIGYQSSGSIGRLLIDKVPEITLMKETIPVRAEIRKISGYSAHADSIQLFDFIKRGKNSLQRVFAIQGEENAANRLAQDVKDKLGISAHVPKLYERVVLE